MSLTRRRRLQRFAADRGDVLVALVLAIPVVGSLAVRAAHEDQPAVVLLAVGALASVFLRRNRPREALLLAVAVEAAIPDNRALSFPVLVVLYTIASRTTWRPAAAWGAAAAAVAIAADAAWGATGTTAHGGLIGDAIGSAASSAAAVAVGLYVAARRRVLAELRDRAERLDRERQLLADRAVGQERLRIAQELHDIVAHNVSLMVVKAQALGVTVDDDRVNESTEAIAELGRQAMTEMHATLRLLRDEAEAPDLSPQPGLAELERLIEQSRGAGLEIELAVEGQPRPLAQGVDLSAFRIVQEALTNVLKHAAGARTKVTLAYQPSGVELTILDTGDEAPRTLVSEPSDGHGVIGMRERAALFGGTLRAEALPDGFRVTATLPYAPVSS